MQAHYDWFVGLSYGMTGFILAGLVVVCWWQDRQVKKRLAQFIKDE